MLHKAIIVKPVSDVVGMGLMAIDSIDEGEVAWWEEGYECARPRSRAEIEAIPQPWRQTYLRWAYQIDDDQFDSLPEFDVLPYPDWASVKPRDPAMYINHSCDPNCWNGYKNRLRVWTARRRIGAGEWVTYDYAMSDTRDHPWTCQCGSPLCRGKILSNDWAIPRLMEAYQDHVAPHVQKLMDKVTVSGHST